MDSLFTYVYTLTLKCDDPDKNHRVYEIQFVQDYSFARLYVCEYEIPCQIFERMDSKPQCQSKSIETQL